MDKIVIGKRLSINKCHEGMKVIEDIRFNNGAIIAPTGTVLTEGLLSRLKKYKVDYIIVAQEQYQNSNDLYSNQQINSEYKSEHEKNQDIMLKPKINITSNSIYKSNVRLMNQILEELENGKKLDFQKIKQIILPLFNEIINNNNFISCLEILKKRSINTYSHSVNTAILAGLLGKWMELDKSKILQLIIGGLLHDIGLTKIPKEILNKKHLNEKEEKLMKQHPILGYEVISRITEIDINTKKLVLTHHEDCCGTGYPFGLERNSIPLQARILSVADRFEEIYLSSEENKDDILSAIEELYNKEFTRLDFKPLHKFVKNMLWNSVGRYAKLSDDRIVEIVFINDFNKFKPLVRINKDIIDLSQSKDVRIKYMI